ncbi:MAG: hypothetical protein SGILL_003199 [Bacillariaceae sp.]
MATSKKNERTVTFEVTFSRNGSNTTFFDNDNPKDVDFLENIELMHCSDWQVDKCKVIVGKADMTKALADSPTTAAKPPKSLLRKGLEMLVLSMFVIPAILGCFHGIWIGVERSNQMFLEEVPVGTATTIEQTLARAYPSRHGFAPKNSQRLLPNTSLVRVREPHVKLYNNYNKQWESVPSTQAQTFYYDGKKQSHPFIRALIHKGWRQVDHFDDAHLLYSHQQKPNWANSLEKWQRFNYIPNKDLWKNPYQFQYHFKEWQSQLQLTQNQFSVYVPETYLLSPRSDDAMGHGKQLILHDIADFQDKLRSDTKEEQFWIIKTEDYKTPYNLAGQKQDTNALLQLTYNSMADIEDSDDDSNEDNIDKKTGTKKRNKFRKFAQKYICDLATWNKQKIEIRVFWAVVSLEPLVVLYHDGYVNIVGDKEVYWDHAVNATTNINSRYAANLQKYPGTDAKQSFAQFEKELDHLFVKPRVKRHGYDDEDYDDKPPPPFPAGSATNHVRSQMKDALADQIQVFQQTSAYQFPDDDRLTADNAFEIYCADFLLDSNLDVWLASTPKSGCKYDDDHFFMMDLHASVFLGLADALEEVWSKQEKLNGPVMPLTDIGNWEAIYGDGLRFKYDGYDPSHRYEQKPSCPAESNLKDGSATEL